MTAREKLMFCHGVTMLVELMQRWPDVVPEAVLSEVFRAIDPKDEDPHQILLHETGDEVKRELKAGGFPVKWPEQKGN